MNFPKVVYGAEMYANEKIGNKIPMRNICKIWMNMFFLLKPGSPSYQIDAKSCWTLACATNYKILV